ncbi:Glucokinase [Corynebacterium kalinowskii]|uniref:Glucokinase n=1 Tax=Corynebacterium kalinowskii TaxID=2675216 RepID=A0A6B8VQ54_9CORY|nr:ROK family protein [Corynebacterium kalinowskii]QGU01697.1 Glucokinase [Corynebacterium kalinowskii]
MSETTAPVTIGFDIGGTNLRAAAVTESGQIVGRLQVQSQGTADSMEDAVVSMTDQLMEQHDVRGMGIAVAGFLDEHREKVRFAPHLPWRDAPLRSRLAARLPIPVSLEHDANSAAIGEAAFGAGREKRTWVLMSIGTGIGAALMHEGEIYRGAFGTAPELGHLPVVPGGRPCPCGKRGCLERYCSGTALAATAQEIAVAEGAPEQLWTGESVIEAARAGNCIGERAIAEFAEWFAVGLSMVVDMFDPELVVIGGGVAKNHDLFLVDGVDKARSLVVGAGHRPFPTVLPAQLGADAGMIGAAEVAWRQLRETQQ